MGEEVAILSLSLVAGFSVVVAYFVMRREMSPCMAAAAPTVVILAVPISMAFGRVAPLVSAVLGLMIAIVADAISTAVLGAKKRGG